MRQHIGRSYLQKGKRMGPGVLLALLFTVVQSQLDSGMTCLWLISQTGLCDDYTKRAVPPQNILYINVIGPDFFTEMKVLETLLRPLMTKYRSTYTVHNPFFLLNKLST